MTEYHLDVNSLWPGVTSRRQYRLLVDVVSAGAFACESYGVAVRDAATGEEAAIPHITTSLTRIDALLELLARNDVSPLHLRDVVEDWL